MANIQCANTRNKIRLKKKSPDRATANIQCASTGYKIRLKKKSRDGAMANASATVTGHEDTGMGQYNSNLIRSTFGTPNGRRKIQPTKMHPLTSSCRMHACRSSPFLCRWTWALHQDLG